MMKRNRYVNAIGPCKAETRARPIVANKSKPCASASSRLGIGVAAFEAWRETSDHKEVSHEQEVHCTPFGRRACCLSGDHQESQRIITEVSSCSGFAQGGCRWPWMVGRQDRGGFQLPRANNRESSQTSGAGRLRTGSGPQAAPGAAHALQ